MENDAAYKKVRERGIALTNLMQTREELMDGRACSRFAAGDVFVYVAHAREVVNAYYGRL